MSVQRKTKNGVWNRCSFGFDLVDSTCKRAKKKTSVFRLQNVNERRKKNLLDNMPSEPLATDSFTHLLLVYSAVMS